MEAIKEYFGRNIRQSGILVALIVLVIAGTWWTGGRLLMPNNVVALVQQNAYVMILAFGIVMVIVAGQIDLSVGSFVGLIGAFLGVMMTQWHWSWPMACLGGIIAGLMLGAWQGFWVAVVGIPAFIVTLAGMLAFRGLAVVIAGITMSGFSQGFINVANGSMAQFFGFVQNPLVFRFGSGDSAASFGKGQNVGSTLDAFTLVVAVILAVAFIVLQVRKHVKNGKAEVADAENAPAKGAAGVAMGVFLAKVILVPIVILIVGYLVSASTGGMPWVLIIVSVLFVAYWFLMSRTTFGRHTYAIGGNLPAAILSGINAKRVNFLLFVSMGFLCAVAGIVTTARSGASIATAGTGYEMDAIAACFVGGTAVQGGVGRTVGAMIGALIMGILNMSMSIMNIDPNWQSVVKGMVLLLAVTLDLASKQRSQLSAGGRF